MNDAKARLLGAVLFTWVAAVAALGQDAPGPVQKAPPPPAPFLNPAPESAAWTITFETGNTKPAPADIKEMDVTKSGDTRREVSVATNGVSTEAWFFKGVKLILDPAAGYAVASDRYQNAKQAPSPAEIDFLDFFAADAANFAGKCTMAGHDCFYYRPRGDYGIYELWIDARTGLPVAMRSDSRGASITQVYRISGDGEALTLPPVFLAAYQLHEKQAQRAQQIQSVLTR